MKSKVLISTLLALTLSISTLTISASASTSQLKLGDVNHDGKINVTDISLVSAHIKGIKALDKDGQRCADINRDDKINVTDVSLIAAHVKGIKPIVDDYVVPDDMPEGSENLDWH